MGRNNIEQAAAKAQERDSEIGSFINQTTTAPEPEKPKKKKTKVLKSAYMTAAVYDALSELAMFRAFYNGERNARNQPTGAGTLINVAACEYLKQHMDELNEYRQRAGKPVAPFPGDEENEQE